MLVGKNGGAITALEKAAGVAININRSAMCLEVESPDITKLASGVEIIQAKIDKLLAEHFEVVVDESLMGILIGKQGATINKFREELDASIDLDLPSRTLVVSEYILFYFFPTLSNIIDFWKRRTRPRRKSSYFEVFG